MPAVMLSFSKPERKFLDFERKFKGLIIPTGNKLYKGTSVRDREPIMASIAMLRRGTF